MGESRAPLTLAVTARRVAASAAPMLLLQRLLICFSRETQDPFVMESHPDKVVDMHCDYIRAGATVIETWNYSVTEHVSLATLAPAIARST
jgi:hypothetical protein|eukprot:COSAG06_NODE_376_length_16647_cov_19.266920_13_plen_91_part_00